mgnify:FL=1
MTEYEKLIVKAENLGAEVREIDFGTDKKSGRCLNNRIYINSRMSEIDKYEVLAEELGHYKTTHGNILNQNSVINRKLENVARREGFNIIVEPNDVVEAIRNNAFAMHEIAEYVHVSVETFFDILENWKKKYGTGIQVGTCYLQFEPCFYFIRDYSNNGSLNYRTLETP